MWCKLMIPSDLFLQNIYQENKFKDDQINSEWEMDENVYDAGPLQRYVWLTCSLL